MHCFNGNLQRGSAYVSSSCVLQVTRDSLVWLEDEISSDTQRRGSGGRGDWKASGVDEKSDRAANASLASDTRPQLQGELQDDCSVL